jgi:hypothetical protein
MSALDFGGSGHLNDAIRQYQVDLPQIPNADWCIGAWIRSDNYPGAGNAPLVLSQNNDFTTTNAITLQLDGDNNGALFLGANLSTGTYKTASCSVTFNAVNLLIAQRRGTNLEVYACVKGGTKSVPDTTTALSGSTGTVPADTWYIGRRAIVPLGECFILTSDSLTAAEVTTLASGKQISTIRTPAYFWPFRDGAVATEPNDGSAGSSYNATESGSDTTPPYGFVTTTEFFALTSAQTLVPISVTAAGNWVAVPSGNLATVLDESTRDDTDYASLDGVVGSTFKVKLTSANDPLSSTGHTFNYVLQGSGNMNVALVQDANTIIASWSHAPAPEGFTQYDQTLNASQADSITNYSNLSVQFTAS